MDEQTTPVGPRKLDLLWTPEQVAKYFSVTTGSVWRWLKRGEMFDPTKIVRLGRRIRIPRSEVERVAGQREERIITTTTHPNSRNF